MQYNFITFLFSFLADPHFYFCFVVLLSGLLSLPPEYLSDYVTVFVPHPAYGSETSDLQALAAAPLYHCGGIAQLTIV